MFKKNKFKLGVFPNHKEEFKKILDKNGVSSIEKDDIVVINGQQIPIIMFEGISSDKQMREINKDLIYYFNSIVVF